MSAEPIDVRRVQTYHAGKLTRQFLAIAVTAFIVGLGGLLLTKGKDNISLLLLLGGGAWTGWELRRLFNPGRPMLALSPDGVLLRIVGVKEVRIPWREIHGVETRDIDVFTAVYGPPRKARFPRVTVLLVSRRFYDSFIHVDSYFMRGPGWKGQFIPRGDMMQIALHHEILSVEPRALREAIDARWRAFRGRKDGEERSID